MYILRTHRPTVVQIEFCLYMMEQYYNLLDQLREQTIKNCQICSQDLNVETETWSKLQDRDFIKKSKTNT